MPSAVSLSAYTAILRTNRNFRQLWSAQMISEIGDWFYTVAVYGLLLEMTGKAQSIAAAIILQVLPQAIFGPVAGVVNDRLSRKRVMIAADLARAAIVLGMLLARTPGTVWLIYPLLFLETVMWGFFEPARSAVIPNIVSESEIGIANALGATTWSFNFAIGFALGGIAAHFLGRDIVFVLNAVSFLASAHLIRRMNFEEPHVGSGVALRAGELLNFTPIREGFRYMGRDPRLAATVFVKCGLGLMGSNWVILPILGDRVFPVGLPPGAGRHDPSLAMSVLMGARGVGALLGPFVSGALAAGKDGRLRLGIVFGYLAAAGGYLALGSANATWAAFASVVFAHAGGSTIWVFSTTLLQGLTEDRYRGRVFSAELGLMMMTISATSYLAGVCVDMGVPPKTFASWTGASMLIPAAAWTWALGRWKDQPR
jgi:MFS family permease